MFNQLSRVIQHNLYEMDSKRCLVRLKETTNLEKIKRNYLSSNQKLASTKTLFSAFLDRVWKVQNAEYESDLFKIIHCSFDCHGSMYSDYASFLIN